VNKGFRLAEIISGGQTGADQGGLLAAQDLGIPTGGLPQGWLTENGPQEALLRSFGLVECTESGYSARTHKNVLHADGTLLGRTGVVAAGSPHALHARPANPSFISRMFLTSVLSLTNAWRNSATGSNAITFTSSMSQATGNPTVPVFKS